MTDINKTAVFATALAGLCFFFSVNYGFVYLIGVFAGLLIAKLDM